MPQSHHIPGSVSIDRCSFGFSGNSSDVLTRVSGEIGRIGHHEDTGGRGWIDKPEVI